MKTLAYVDASALVKLIVDEAESGALLRWAIEIDRVVTSRIGIVETVRAASRREHDVTARSRVLDDVGVVEVDVSIAAVAATLASPALRTLDAIHLATALALGPEVDAFVTYDDRLAEAARAMGLPVVRPA